MRAQVHAKAYTLLNILCQMKRQNILLTTTSPQHKHTGTYDSNKFFMLHKSHMQKQMSQPPCLVPSFSETQITFSSCKLGLDLKRQKTCSKFPSIAVAKLFFSFIDLNDIF
jgi:hypothetical protein